MPFAQTGNQKKACCDECAKGGVCLGGLGDAKENVESAVWTALVIAAWIAFNELAKMQKGRKSFFDRWR